MSESKITTAADNLVLWVFDNKEIFNSSQYMDLMNLVQKLIVGDSNSNDTQIEDDENIILRLNNYRLPESDSDMEDDEATEVDNIDSLESSSDDEVDGTTYTGAYINSY